MESIGEAGDEARRRSLGRLAGLLYCFGALLSVPSALALDPGPPAWVYWLIPLAFLCGIACFVVPWDRIAGQWFHLIPVSASLLVTAGVWGSEMRGSLSSWLYMLIGIMVAYSFRSRRTIGAYVAFISLCLAAPVVDPFISTGDALRTAIVGIPSLVAAVAVVTYFRERLEAGRRAYQELARLDPLTGVGNYRTLYERLEYEIARHSRHGRRFAVMLLDLDGFKEVNETYGHLEGDRVLREVGRVLSRTVRDQDTVARQGGDEFSVLAPETAGEELPALARRLQQALATVQVGGRGLAASTGWAVYPDQGETADALLGAADAALWSDKAQTLAGVAAEGTRGSTRLRPVREAGGAAAPSGGSGR
jgi:diguanylate cyclase (GGDEF)-like protein